MLGDSIERDFGEGEEKREYFFKIKARGLYMTQRYTANCDHKMLMQ